MSLTSYRAAPPRVIRLLPQAKCRILTDFCRRQNVVFSPIQFSANGKGRPIRRDWRPVCPVGGPWFVSRRFQHALSRPGSDLLSRALRRSTISAGAFHGRVRNGNGCSHPAITTRSAKSMLFFEKLFCRAVRSSPFWGAMGTRNENDQADRAISTGKLHALPHFHTRPINVVVFHGSQGILVSRWVSRLDAFSGYAVRLLLPCDSAGATTGPPEIRPSRSSRTRDRSFQYSYTHGR